MSSYLERLQASLPDPPQPPQKGTRVFWIDLMRIIGCVAVPIVHAINFTGTPGQPDPKHAGAFHCGYDARDPAQLHGRYYTPDTHSPESIRLEQYLERRYMSSMAIFFFASGAALYYSLVTVRPERLIKTLWSRNMYLMTLLLFGMVTCVIPVNMIWHGARTVHDAVFAVNPFYHLGFLITLVMFTLVVTPLCWAICRRSLAGWMIWTFEMSLLIVGFFMLKLVSLNPSVDVLMMVLLNTVNLIWVLVASYQECLREWRAPVATILHICTFAIPKHFKDIWHLREAKTGNGITTLYLVLLLYMLPFIIGMLGEAFPTKRDPTRAYLKFYSAVFLYMVFSYWTEPVGSKGWMEAYSIRMFDARTDRCMYLANMWATVWFLYEVLKVYEHCPFPSVVTRLNMYSLLLYVYHPLFLSLTSCYVVAYIHSVPCVLETAMLYASAIVGCGCLYWLIFAGWPKAKAYIEKKNSNNSAHEAEPLMARDSAA